MSSDSSNIQARLAELHRELEKAGSVDPQLRKLLEQLDADIDRLLGPEESEDDLQQSVEEQIDAIAAGFAARHPTLDAVLREIAAALGRMGI